MAASDRWVVPAGDAAATVDAAAWEVLGDERGVEVDAGGPGGASLGAMNASGSLAKLLVRHGA